MITDRNIAPPYADHLAALQRADKCHSSSTRRAIVNPRSTTYNPRHLSHRQKDFETVPIINDGRFVGVSILMNQLPSLPPALGWDDGPSNTSPSSNPPPVIQDDQSERRGRMHRTHGNSGVSARACPEHREPPPPPPPSPPRLREAVLYVAPPTKPCVRRGAGPGDEYTFPQVHLRDQTGGRVMSPLPFNKRHN
jgi:hypothetical protein